VAPAVWAARDTEATRGVTLGLGALPGRMLAPHAERVIEVRPMSGDGCTIRTRDSTSGVVVDSQPAAIVVSLMFTHCAQVRPMSGDGYLVICHRP
jgi:hypothetical protein